MVGPSPAPLVAVQGNRLTLAVDPLLHDYRPTPHEDWTSAAAMVIAGRGVGQYGIVTAHDGRPFRLYGSVHECVVVENSGRRMDGFLDLGLDSQRWSRDGLWG